MRLTFAALLTVVAACGGKESKKEPPPPPVENVARPVVAADAAVAVATPDAAPAPPPAASEPQALEGYDFTPLGQALLVVGACGNGALPEGYNKQLVDTHCALLTKVQADYEKSWLSIARPFIAQRVPKDLPKKVVYPFAGGDLSTALTVYPDADEITTLSLEPAGDPRTIDALNRGKTSPSKAAKPGAAPAPAALTQALATVRYELEFLYRVNFSNTMNMIGAMRGGALPTQLIFGLSALKVHGFEVVGLRYFKLDEAGTIQYLSDADVAKAPAVTAANADTRNRIFANAELRFRKPGGRVQIYRHIQVNLDDEHLAKDPRVVKHLVAKGPIAGMTKAASYLLSWDTFKTMRQYLIDHVQWMISDCTGIAPKWGKQAGFEYETYGTFNGAHIGAGNQIWRDWNAEFVAQAKREIPFRFGYYDKNGKNHLVIVRKAAAK
ncbi:MAG TPA: hypothetical protein VK427_23475 [Kofleriaceae bacterium]|nr:hypothetical protein [Kofleriaceae bacterium]